MSYSLNIICHLQADINQEKGHLCLDLRFTLSRSVRGPSEVEKHFRLAAHVPSGCFDDMVLAQVDLQPVDPGQNGPLTPLRVDPRPLYSFDQESSGVPWCHDLRDQHITSNNHFEQMISMMIVSDQHPCHPKNFLYRSCTQGLRHPSFVSNN